MVARHCVLAGIGYVHVLYRHLVALLRFCKTLVRKMHIIIQQNISCDVVIIA